MPPAQYWASAVAAPPYRAVQALHLQVARHYGVPLLSYADATWPAYAGAYLHEHRKQVLMLRCLATKKRRATTTDPVMNFLVKLGDNGVIWKVLSFWPPPP